MALSLPLGQLACKIMQRNALVASKLESFPCQEELLKRLLTSIGDAELHP